MTAPPSTSVGPPAGDGSPGARWRGIPRRWRVVLSILLAATGVDVVVAVAGSFGTGGTPSAQGSSSSYDPSAVGTQAMAELLAHFGHPVQRLLVPFTATAVPSDATLVVADPIGWDGAQARAVHDFAASGGRVVLAGGPFASADLRTVLGRARVPLRSPVGVATARAVGHAPEVAGVAVVDADVTDGAWDETGATTAILRGSGGDLAVAADVGSGRVVLLASASPLRNDYLGDADNAAFALDLAGGPGRTVAFDENAHGFGSGSGLGALPARWKWVLVVAALAVGVWVVSAARRFGPPVAAERVLAPARVEYVNGLATVLAAGDARRVGEAVAPLALATRASLCRYLGVPDATGDDTLRVMAHAAGLSDAFVGACLAAPDDAGHALALGRAHAWLEQERRSHR